MATYGYGPPPPPPPAPLPNGPAPGFNQQYGLSQYQQSSSGHGQGHSAHSGRGGRGGHSGRGEYHGQAPQFPYSQPPPPTYGGPHHAPPPPHAPLAPQNYHPNYAPQMYQQPQYGHQQHPQYAQQQQQHHVQPPSQQPPPPPQQHPQHPYSQHYPPYPQHQSGPPHQQWAGPSPVGHQPVAAPHYGGGRGRGGHHGDRGGHKPAPAMGPPLRMGFDNRSPEQHAPVSAAYPPQSYGPPQGAGPYGAMPPYQQGYPHHSAPHVAAPGAPHYDPYHGGQSGSGRASGRGGSHNSNFRGGRSHMSGDKMRHNNYSKKPNGGQFTPHNAHQKPDAPSAGKKKKRKTNTLGLTPGDESDDDANEEEKLVELIGPDAPNPTDISAWIAERKSRFPTQARVKAKAATAAAGGDKTKDGAKDAAVSSLEKQKLKAEKLRKQLEKVESSIKRKREQQDEGDDMRDVADSSSASEESQSDSEKPEVLPSRPAVPPPTKKADPTKHCKYFSTGGICGKKGKCRFVHDEAVRSAALREREMNGGRITLQQRLILNDKDQEDLTIVKTLQYLKEKGLMAGAEKITASSPPRTAETETEATSQLPLSPTNREAGLPSPPPQRTTENCQDRYQGWDLSGFGNTGGRNDAE